MTIEEIKTDNELIAEFMERPFRPVKAGYETGSSFVSIGIDFKTKAECLAFCDKENEHRSPDDSFFPLPVPTGFDFELHYDTSWDWLMPVVEKISQTDFDFNNCDRPEEYYNLMRTTIFSPINEVYEEVVKFIKWYNTTITDKTV